MHYSSFSPQAENESSSGRSAHRLQWHGRYPAGRRPLRATAYPGLRLTAPNMGVMGSSNRGSLCKAFLSGRVVLPGSGSSSQSAWGRCTIGLREGRTSQGGRRTPLWPAVHPIKRDGPAHVPAGTSGQRSRASAIFNLSSGCQTGGPVEELAGPQHGVHHDRELPGHGDRGSLEADLLAQSLPPCR